MTYEREAVVRLLQDERTFLVDVASFPYLLFTSLEAGSKRDDGLKLVITVDVPEVVMRDLYEKGPT